MPGRLVIRLGGSLVQMRATATVLDSGPDRDRLYDAQAELMPGFKDYEKATDRVIPVVVLERS